MGISGEMGASYPGWWAGSILNRPQNLHQPLRQMSPFGHGHLSLQAFVGDRVSAVESHESENPVSVLELNPPPVGRWGRKRELAQVVFLTFERLDGRFAQIQAVEHICGGKYCYPRKSLGLRRMNGRLG